MYVSEQVALRGIAMGIFALVDKLGFSGPDLVNGAQLIDVRGGIAILFRLNHLDRTICGFRPRAGQ